jgi:hypothetical protein
MGVGPKTYIHTLLVLGAGPLIYIHTLFVLSANRGFERETLEGGSSNEITLTTFLKFNQQELSAARYIYTEISEQFIFDKKSHAWQPRIKYCKLISRTYTVSLNETERYYLRLLNLKVKGGTSFDNLKTVDNFLHEIF